MAKRKKKPADEGSSPEADADLSDDFISLRNWGFPVLLAALIFFFLKLRSVYLSGLPWLHSAPEGQFIAFWTIEAKLLHSNMVFGLGLLISLIWFYWSFSRENRVILGLYLLLFLPLWGSSWSDQISHRKNLLTVIPNPEVERVGVQCLSRQQLAVVGPVESRKYSDRYPILALERERNHQSNGPPVFVPRLSQFSSVNS